MSRSERLLQLLQDLRRHRCPVSGQLLARDGESALTHGAVSAMAKISAVLPPELRREMEASALLIGADGKTPEHTVDADLLRICCVSRYGPGAKKDETRASRLATLIQAWRVSLRLP
ncbi:MAG: hypothetical protein HY254_25585 [Burkholderiales bacterium]|nr:hypothetical protein [Burkholderiales bacterium]